MRSRDAGADMLFVFPNRLIPASLCHGDVLLYHKNVPEHHWSIVMLLKLPRPTYGYCSRRSKHS